MEADKLKGALKTLFQSIDVDKNGVIDINELRELFRKIGIELNDEEFRITFSSFDINNDGKIDFSEFVNGLQNRT